MIEIQAVKPITISHDGDRIQLIPGDVVSLNDSHATRLIYDGDAVKCPEHLSGRIIDFASRAAGIVSEPLSDSDPKLVSLKKKLQADAKLGAKPKK